MTTVINAGSMAFTHFTCVFGLF